MSDTVRRHPEDTRERKTFFVIPGDGKNIKEQELVASSSESGHWWEPGAFKTYKEGTRCFVNREDAEKAANSMIERKMASLRKQIAELEKSKHGF